MSGVALFGHLLLVIAPAAVANDVVRRAAVEGRVEAAGQARSKSVHTKAYSHVNLSAVSNSKQGSQSKQGLSFWHALRKELETKRNGASGNGVHETSLLSADEHRDILWQTVREVDAWAGKSVKCSLTEDAAYLSPQGAGVLLEGKAAYTKEGISSARECAMMCAAVSLGGEGTGARGTDNCKSFIFNKTAKDCKFLNFAGQARVKDKCCTSGPACNVAKLRRQIQLQYFRAVEIEMLEKKKEKSEQQHGSSALAETIAEKKVAAEKQVSVHIQEKNERAAAASLISKPATKVSSPQSPGISSQKQAPNLWNWFKSWL